MEHSGGRRIRINGTKSGRESSHTQERKFWAHEGRWEFSRAPSGLLWSTHPWEEGSTIPKLENEATTPRKWNFEHVKWGLSSVTPKKKLWWSTTASRGVATPLSMIEGGTFGRFWEIENRKVSRFFFESQSWFWNKTSPCFFEGQSGLLKEG